MIHESVTTTNHPSCVSLYLGDGLFSPARIALGLVKVMRRRLEDRRFVMYGSQIVLGFATASSSLKDRDLMEINAPPAETHWLANCHDKRSFVDGVHGHVSDLTPDTWTIILKESYRRAPHADDAEDRRTARSIVTLNIGMLRSKRPIQALRDQQISPEDVDVVDLETFLAKTSPSPIDEADLNGALEELKAYADKLGPVRESGEELVLPLGADDAVRVVQRVFSSMCIDSSEGVRQEASTDELGA